MKKYILTKEKIIEILHKQNNNILKKETEKEAKKYILNFENFENFETDLGFKNWMFDFINQNEINEDYIKKHLSDLKNEDEILKRILKVSWGEEEAEERIDYLKELWEETKLELSSELLDIYLEDIEEDYQEEFEAIQEAKNLITSSCPRFPDVINRFHDEILEKEGENIDIYFHIEKIKDAIFEDAKYNGYSHIQHDLLEEVSNILWKED